MMPCIILEQHEFPPRYLYTIIQKLKDTIVQKLKDTMKVIILGSEACNQNSSEMQIYSLRP